jgi:hypothetical protein
LRETQGGLKFDRRPLINRQASRHQAPSGSKSTHAGHRSRNEESRALHHGQGGWMPDSSFRVSTIRYDTHLAVARKWRPARGSSDLARDIPGPSPPLVKSSRHKPCIFHMSWTKSKDKIKFYQQMGEWYLTEVCLTTDHELDLAHLSTPNRPHLDRNLGLESIEISNTTHV